MGRSAAAPRALLLSLLSGCGSATPPTGIEGPGPATAEAMPMRASSPRSSEPVVREPLRPESAPPESEPAAPVAARPTERADDAAPGPPRLSPVAILPLGDSITQGDGRHDTWRRPLYRELLARGHDVDFVGSQQAHEGGSAPSDDFDHDHEGHWGYRADELLAELGGWVQGYVPDVVLLHAGTNDAFQAESTDSTLEDLAGLIRTLRGRNPELRVLLAKLVPASDRNAAARIAALNARLDDFARSITRVESPVVIVDHASGFDAEQMTFDGVHPNALGERQMAERWLGALEPLLNAPAGDER